MMTTIDAIKLLPIAEELKLKILKQYTYLEPAQRLTIQRLAWSSYHLLREEKVNATVERQFQGVLDGTSSESFGPDFYQRAVKKTDQQISKKLHEEGSSLDLAAARHAMRQIVGEIRAVKKGNKQQLLS